MAITNTKITDLVPSEKALDVAVNLILSEKNELVNSGLTARGPEVDAVAGGGPRKASLAYLEPLDTTNVNISTDDLNDEGDMGKLTANEFTVCRHDQNWSWGSSDLARMVTQYDDQGGIRAGIAQYWNTRQQMTAQASVNGVFAAAQTVIAAGAAQGATDEQKAAANDAKIIFAGDTNTAFDMKNVYKLTSTAGLYADMFNVLIIDPALYATLQGQEANGFVPASKTQTGFADYQGFTLLRSKAFIGKVILGRSGGIAFGSGVPAGMVSIELERRANGGTGSGGDILHSRQSFVVHPQGTDYVGSVSPSLTDLSAATSWKLEVPAEQFGFRVLTYKA